MLVADRGNARVRLVDQLSGIIDTIAGNGIPGFSGDGGLAFDASLRSPRGVGVDSLGQVLIADARNNRIRQVDGAGVITTVAGTDRPEPPEPPVTSCPPSIPIGPLGDGGPAVDALLCTPFAVVADNQGAIYFSDTANHRIRWIDPETGLIDTIAGGNVPGFSGDGGLANEALLNSPRDLALGPSLGILAGGLYVADARNHHVRRIDLIAGTIDSVIGTAEDGVPVPGFGGDGDLPPTQTFLNFPRRIAFDSSGSLYIADVHNARIRRVDAETGVLSTVAGVGHVGFSGDGGAALDASISFPSGLAIDSLGNLYFSELLNGRVRMVRAPF